MVEQAVHFMAERKQRETGRGSGQDKAFKNMALVTNFLQLGPTSRSFHHFPKISSNYESINGLTL
jgi:hypothetical protein